MKSLMVLILTLALLWGEGVLAKLRVAVVNYGSIEPSEYKQLVSDLEKESANVVGLFPNGSKDSSQLEDELRKKNYNVESKDGQIFASKIQVIPLEIPSTGEIIGYQLLGNDGHVANFKMFETAEKSGEEMKNELEESQESMLKHTSSGYYDRNHEIWLVNDMKEMYIMYTRGLKRLWRVDNSPVTMAGSKGKLTEFAIYDGKTSSRETSLSPKTKDFKAHERDQTSIPLKDSTPKEKEQKAQDVREKSTRTASLTAEPYDSSTNSTKQKAINRADSVKKSIGSETLNDSQINTSGGGSAVQSSKPSMQSKGKLSPETVIGAFIIIGIIVTAVIVIVFGIFLFKRPSNPQQFTA